MIYGDFLGCPVVKTLCFQHRGVGLISGQGNKIPHAAWLKYLCVCVCGVSVKKGRTAYDRKIGTDSGMKSLRPEVRSLKRLIKLTAHFQY